MKVDDLDLCLCLHYNYWHLHPHTAPSLASMYLMSEQIYVILFLKSPQRKALWNSVLMHCISYQGGWVFNQQTAISWTVCVWREKSFVSQHLDRCLLEKQWAVWSGDYLCALHNGCMFLVLFLVVQCMWYRFHDCLFKRCRPHCSQCNYNGQDIISKKRR